MLPGQGSQFSGMGKEILDRFPDALKEWHELDEIIKAEGDFSLIDAITLPKDRLPREWFRNTRFTHPLVFAFHYGWGRYLLNQGICFDGYIGYSLGELTALTLAGKIKIEETLRMTLRMGKLIEELCPTGGMLAILDHESVVQDFFPLFEELEIAARNFDGAFVVSGSNSHLEEVQRTLKEAQIATEMLEVQHPFHSQGMEPVKSRLLDLLKQNNFTDNETPVLSSGMLCEWNASVWEKGGFWNVLRGPVEFQELIHTIIGKPEQRLIDLSASGTLATMARRIASSDQRHSITTLLSRIPGTWEKLTATLKELA